MKIFPTFSTNPFLKDKINRIIWLINLVLMIGTLVFIYFQFVPRVEMINLQHNIYFGISRIGEWWQIFYYPLYGAIILVVNFVLSTIFYSKNKTTSHVLASVTLLAQFIIIWQVFLVMRLNIS